MNGPARPLPKACAVAISAALLCPAQVPARELPASDATITAPKEALVRLALNEKHKPAPRRRQESRKQLVKPEPKKQEAPPPPEPPPPPYDAQLMRLGEVLGGLSFLRDLCGDGDGDDWRGKMAQLRDTTAPAGARRQKLTASFNHGFRGYELTYRSCTPNARLIISRYLEEAEKLSRDVVSRYGNP
jgi:uncharacterized protein (TIGR02301 family)